MYELLDKSRVKGDGVLYLEETKSKDTCKEFLYEDLQKEYTKTQV